MNALDRFLARVIWVIPGLNWLLRRWVSHELRGVTISGYVACEPNGLWSVHITNPPDGKTVFQRGEFREKATAENALAGMLRTIRQEQRA